MERNGLLYEMASKYYQFIAVL